MENLSFETIKYEMHQVWNGEESLQITEVQSLPSVNQFDFLALLGSICIIKLLVK